MLLAASSSTISVVSSFNIARQFLHWLHGSPSIGFSQLTALAKILAIVVFPIPRKPLNIYACEVLFYATAFFKVLIICFWPITSPKFLGL